jgi:hypothetical protein
MTFLKKLGMVLGNVAGIVAGVGPIASALFPAQSGQINEGIGVFRQIVAIVQQVELISNTVTMTGEQKLQAAIVQIGALIKMTDMVKTNKIQDQALFDKAIAGFAQASVDLQNSLAAHEIKSESVSA